MNYDETKPDRWSRTKTFYFSTWHRLHAEQYKEFHTSSTCDLLLNRNWSFHGAVGRRLAVERFRWQVRQSGMHYRQSGRSRADFSHFQASFEDLLLHVISHVSQVQRIRDFLVMRYINVRFTYLLTNQENCCQSMFCTSRVENATIEQGEPTNMSIGVGEMQIFVVILLGQFRLWHVVSTLRCVTWHKCFYYEPACELSFILHIKNTYQSSTNRDIIRHSDRSKVYWMIR